MRKVKSKGKKLSAGASNEDPTSDEERIPTQKRRGRPHKAIKDEKTQELSDERDEEDSEETTNGSRSKGSKNNKADSIGNKKRKSNDNVEIEEVEKFPGNESMGRSKQSRHRRKGKPCRAPEAVVECT